ncbi:MAG: FtsW/RodA/SpoVE family cell cycle protein [Zoogloea oleivorans]|jgi:cell division protein FtsW (lipid II flippase)|uniref:FtsW/RodA/SpoVE family cell cycle protein n=1 Tax=Zoogloea oleivorans TaxID=1552750 RepID=UPI002A35B191|nr:FtsW/RodA/SpoVE family cell cycle protein [Zoogloea oleivorans]MDY0037309.1 FtsW/RodA/SpoVE family cell cycle protein [Zoogloea oleivorans]
MADSTELSGTHRPAGTHIGFELVLLLLTILVLYCLSLDLTASDVVVGRGDRYIDESSRNAVRMQWIALNAGKLLALLALTGWGVLMVGRQAGSAPVAFGLGCAMWAAGAYLFYGDASQPLWLLASALSAGCSLLFRGRYGCQPLQAPSNPAIYPVFVLLSGLGWLWLIDFSSQAMAQEPNPWLGMRRADHMLLSFFVMTTGAGIAPWLTGVAVRALARLDSGSPLSTSRAGHLLGFVAWVLMVIAFFQFRRASGGNAAIQGLTSELLRAPAYFLLAWVMYRWGQGRDWQRWLIGVGTTGMLLGLGLGRTHDAGQVLVAAVATCALVAGVLATALHAGTNRAGGWVIIGAAIFGASLVVSGFAALYQLEPLFANMPGMTHIALRISAIKAEFTGYYQYLSELRWFMADSPAWGYGLGRTPYCGTLTHVVSAQVCRGLPREVPFDYVFAALAGIWGQIGAWVICALTATWLVMLCGRPPLPEAHPQKHSQQYANWIAVCFSGATLAQLFVTCLGSLGVVPLTGITFPLLSHGGSSLLVTAIVAALVVNQVQAPQRKPLQ